MVSLAASIFFAVCYLALAGGFYFRKKSDEKFYGITWLALIFVMIQCYHVFIAAVINVVHIPVNLVTFGIFDLIAAVYFWLPVYKKKETQKYIYGIVDIVFLILAVVVVAWFAKNRFYGFHLSINYKTVDPAPRFREAMDLVNDQSISRMFYAQVVNGTMIELLAPFEQIDYYYRFYVLSDVVQLLVSGVMFFGVIRKYIKGKFLAVAGVLASLIFLLGYPLNSTIYGFTYLGMSLTLVAMLLVVTDLFLEEKINKKFNIFLLMLGCHAMFQCYALFMPVTYLAIIFAIFLKQYRKKILISKDTVLTCLAVFLFPCISGLWYTYMDVFVKDDVSVGSAISAEGAIYRDLYSNFLPFLPLAIYGFAKLVKDRKNKLISWFAPFFAIFTFGMFALAYHNRSVSTYYFYKDYYMIWLIICMLGFYGVSRMAKEARTVTACYIGTWAFVLVMFVSGLETRIYNNNNLFMDSAKGPQYNDLVCFNINTMKEPPYAEPRMAMAHYVYQKLIETGKTDKPVPCAYNDDQFYWYEGVTNQRLSDYMYWKSDYDTFKTNLEKNCDYVSVMIDSRIYVDNQEYFDSMEKVFENEIGFVARVNKD